MCDVPLHIQHSVYITGFLTPLPHTACVKKKCLKGRKQFVGAYGIYTEVHNGLWFLCVDLTSFVLKQRRPCCNVVDVGKHGAVIMLGRVRRALRRAGAAIVADVSISQPDRPGRGRISQ